MPDRAWRITAVAALLALAAVLIYDNIRARRYGEALSGPDAVLREVRPLRELVTVRYSIQKVTGLKEDEDPMGLGSESILLIVQAQVLGGVDLSQMRERDIRMDGKGVVDINLPAPRILHIHVDEKNTQVWDHTKTWWTPWVPYDLDIEKKARLAALEAVKQQALEMGILLEAKVNAQNLIRALLMPLGIRDVRFGQTQS